MRLLFEFDKKDYDPNAEHTYRGCSSGIVIRGKTIAMCYVEKEKMYVIPGGGIEEGETREQAVIREMHEETGLRIIPDSIKEYGYVHFARKGKYEPVYIQDDFYFLCQAEDRMDKPQLMEDEIESGYRFEFVNLFKLIEENKERVQAGEPPYLPEVQRIILEKLVEDGLLGDIR